MSKFVSYKPGKIINGNGSESDAIIFVNDLGQEEAIAANSPIVKLLTDEVDGIVVPVVVPEAPVQPVVEPTNEPTEAATAMLELPAAGDSSAANNNPVDSVVTPTVDTQS